jgi:hypothetical protein
VLHAAASAFVTGADRAVLAGAIATLVGALIAFRTLRAPQRTPVPAPVPTVDGRAIEAPAAGAEVPAAAIETPAPAAEAPVAAEVLAATGAASG